MRRRQPLADDLLDLFATELRHPRRRLQLLKRGERRTYGVDRVVRAVRLSEDVLDAGGLDHSAHRASGNHASAWRGRLEHDASRSQLEVDLVRDGRAYHRHGDHVALGDLHPLADGFGHFFRLADSRADAPIHVADDDQRAERELASALDDLGDAVDAYDAAGKLGTLSARVGITRTHALKLQSGFARGVS